MEHFEKSIIPVIESVYPSFTPLERTVADFFIHNTDESDLSARHVSELLYVSEASLSRFAKKCGYTGYREFVYRYQEGLNAALPGTDDHIKQVLNTYQELLNKSYSLADRAQIDRICHILTSKRRVYVYGLGSSGLSAQEMKLRFMLAGVDIEAITDIHILKMNAVLLNESCAAIGITVSGQTPEVLRALGAAKEKGASTILFTSRSSSDYDAFCDEVLLLAVKEHLKNGGAISPQFPILVMIDVLYSHFLTTDSERKEALYEYAVTNGEMDVDKIIARRKRVHLITVSTAKFDAYGEMTDAVPDDPDRTIVLCSDNTGEGEYYADLETEEYGATRIIFTPNEAVQEAINAALPRQLRSGNGAAK